MRLPLWTTRRLLLLIGGCLFSVTSPVQAQGDGAGQSLGGYGAIADEAMSRTSSGSLIPYAGGFAGFMPYRMAGGGALAFRTRPSSAMGPARMAFGMSALSAGLSPMSGAMGLNRGPGISSSSTMRSPSGVGTIVGGLGQNPLMRQGMPSTIGMDVMPPSFGYPFRQPTSVLTPSSGMSMSMP
jgi:hypothetical protein